MANVTLDSVEVALYDIPVLGDYVKLLKHMIDPKFGLFAKGPLSQLHFRFLQDFHTGDTEVTYMMYGIPEGDMVPIIFKDDKC